MTRFLSQALGAVEPMFGHSIQQLEQASGRPSADIRLTTDLMQRARQKITALGLDPNDTTGPELYNALHARLARDESEVRATMAIAPDASAAQILSRVQQTLTTHDMPRNCFALKISVAKRLLRKKQPKQTMKQLGYRSLESFLKHESVAAIYAAAVLVESDSWWRAYRELYTKLQPSDFEQRPIAIVYPSAKRWEALAAKHINAFRQNIFGFKELGAVVLLPMQQVVDGQTITTLVLALTAMNDIRAHSSYVKLQQVKPDFGKIIQQISLQEPFTSATLAGQPVSWRMIQRFYGRFKEAYHADIFEPHVQPEDLAWHDAETALAAIKPTLAFWQDAGAVCLLHDDHPVSMNILDVALSYCNHLPFKDRIVHFVRDSLWQELMMRYLNQQNLEEAVHMQLSSDLIDDQALA